MNNFFDVKGGSPRPCIHPLLLSLMAAFNESTHSPNIFSVSEDDPRVLNHKYYTSLSNFPPLEIHVTGQNGMLLSLIPMVLHLNQQLPVANVRHLSLHKI
jgi:hypothetical protein